MKLKSLLQQLSDRPTVPVVVVLSSAIVMLSTLWLAHPGQTLQVSRDALGASLAEGLAALAVEPLQRQDRLHMSVIANRLLGNPRVSAVAIYDPRDEPFALTGERGGDASYTHPVTADDAVIGYARITLHPAAPWPPAGLWPMLIAVLAGAPLLAWLITAAVPPAWRHWQGRLRARAERARPAAVEQSADADTDAGAAGRPAADDPAAAETPPPRLILVVNLYNQLMLAPALLEAELSLARELAQRVAAVHGGSVQSLPGTGLVLEFSTRGNDRAFQCVCAGLVLKRLLEAAEPQGEYRLGLHATGRAEPLCMTLDDTALADACLLSAMARGEGLVLSREALAEVERSQRLALSELDSLVLEQLEASAGAVHVQDVGSSHRSLLERQFLRLRDQDSAAEPDAAASESTF